MCFGYVVGRKLLSLSATKYADSEIPTTYQFMKTSKTNLNV